MVTGINFAETLNLISLSNNNTPQRVHEYLGTTPTIKEERTPPLDTRTASFADYRSIIMSGSGAIQEQLADHESRKKNALSTLGANIKKMKGINGVRNRQLADTSLKSITRAPRTEVSPEVQRIQQRLNYSSFPEHTNQDRTMHDRQLIHKLRLVEAVQ